MTTIFEALPHAMRTITLDGQNYDWSHFVCNRPDVHIYEDDVCVFTSTPEQNEWPVHLEKHIRIEVEDPPIEGTVVDIQGWPCMSDPCASP